MTVLVVLTPARPASATSADHRAMAVAVFGAVGAPSAYTVRDLAGLPQTTLTDRRRPGPDAHELTGVLLQTLIDRADPLLPTAKNPALRVSAVVSGRHHERIALAWGELDPAFGNHPGLLVLSRDGRPVRGAPDLVFPDDTDGRRTVQGVRRIEVAVAGTGATDTPMGTLVVAVGPRTVAVPLARLATLPHVTRTVNFLAGGGPQTRVETGPALAAVLRTAGVHEGPAATVAATGSDGYVAVVTPGEERSGGRPLMISLVEDGVVLTRPRLVPAGDVRGGRYVSDLTTLVVSGSHRCDGSGRGAER